MYNIFILYLYICTKYLSTSDIRLFLLHRCYLVVIKNIVLLLYYCTSVVPSHKHNTALNTWWKNVFLPAGCRICKNIHSCKKCIIFHFGWINKIMYSVRCHFTNYEKSVILLLWIWVDNFILHNFWIFFFEDSRL